MERQTIAANFWVAPDKVRRNGLAPINVTITHNGQRCLFCHKAHLVEWVLCSVLQDYGHLQNNENILQNVCFCRIYSLTLCVSHISTP